MGKNGAARYVKVWINLLPVGEGGRRTPLDLSSEWPVAYCPQFRVRGGLTFAGVNGQPEGLYEVPRNNWMPRVGATYKLDDNTVLRTGYGVFYGFLGQRRGDVITTGFSANTCGRTSPLRSSTTRRNPPEALPMRIAAMYGSLGCTRDGSSSSSRERSTRARSSTGRSGLRSMTI
jgi:hypothetical protein